MRPKVPSGFVDQSLPRPPPGAHDREIQQDQPTDSPATDPQCTRERFIPKPLSGESRFPTPELGRSR